MPKNKYYIFTDASFDQKSKTAVGASLTIILKPEDDILKTNFNNVSIPVTFFQNTDIASAEILTFIWALESIPSQNSDEIFVYTDCKNIFNLPSRRERLEKNNFHSKRSNKTLGKAELYKIFYDLCDRLQPTIKWIRGHASEDQKTYFENIFSLVDQKARASLRNIRS